MNDREQRAAINRTIPLFRHAGELHEEIQNNLTKYREMVGDLFDKAKNVGHALESAAFSLKSSGIDVSFYEALAAHAPNISAKQCDKYRRWSKGQITDPRQMGLLGFELKPAEEDSDCDWRAKADAWEKACRYSDMLFGVTKKKPIESWPESQRTELALKLEPLAKALWPERFN